MWGECVEHTGHVGSSTRPGTAHLPCMERLHEASCLRLLGAVARGMDSPSVHACSECTGTYLPPVYGRSGCLLGTTWHQACCQSCGGIRRLVLVPNILVSLFFLVQNFLMGKRSMLRSIPKGSSSAQICDLCAAQRMGLSKVQFQKRL